MVLKPDYGTHLRAQGVGRGVQHFFHSVWVDHFTLLGPEAGFTTFVVLTHEGQEYGASFDFSMAQWEAFLEALPEDEADGVVDELQSVRALPHTFEFTRPHAVGLQARLGAPQRGAHDTFVPLVVERVWGAEEGLEPEPPAEQPAPASPLDSQLLTAGITAGGFYIEAGVRRYDEWCARMVEDVGEGIRPYLRSIYSGVRYWPGFEEIARDMDSDAEIDAAR